MAAGDEVSYLTYAIMKMSHITHKRTIAILAVIVAVIAAVGGSPFTRNIFEDSESPGNVMQASEPKSASDIIGTNIERSAGEEAQISDVLFAPTDSTWIPMIEPWAQSEVVPTIGSYTRHRFVQLDTEKFKRALVENENNSQFALNFFDDTVLTVTITFLNVRDRGSVSARGRTADGRTVWIFINPAGQAKITTNTDGKAIALITSPLPPTQLIYEFDMAAETAKRGPVVN